MQQTVLSSIAQPELWKLVMLLGPKSVDVAAYPPLGRDEALWCRLPYGKCTLRALEDTVYGNTELLGDFRSVTCIADYSPAVVMPAEADDTQARIIYNATTDETSAEAADLPVCLYDCGPVKVAMRQPKEISDFLQRTFFRVDIRCGMAERIRYFLSRNPQGTAVYAPVECGRVKLVVVHDGSLLLANDFDTHTASDAAYYILWAMKELNIDFATAAVYAGGVGRGHDELLQLLRRYLPAVKPMPMPSLRYRGSKSTLEAPYDLLIHPVCE